NGVRQRNGRESGAAAAENERGAHGPLPRRAQSTASSAQFPRRLAPFALPRLDVSTLAVSVPRAAAERPRPPHHDLAHTRPATCGACQLRSPFLAAGQPVSLARSPDAVVLVLCELPGLAGRHAAATASPHRLV